MKKIVVIVIMSLMIFSSLGAVGLKVKDENENITLKTPSGTFRQALCVGVNGGNLRYCDDDAINLYNLLTRPENGWDPANCEYVIQEDHDASESAIKNKLNSMASKSTANTVSFFSYSGHGTWDSDDEAAICLEGGSSNYMWASELRPILDNFKGRVVCVFDSCHAGGMQASHDQPAFDADEYVSEFLGELSSSGSENRVLLMACTLTQTTPELSELEAGLWTYYVHEGLGSLSDANANGIITAEEVFSYAAPKAHAYTSRVDPQIFDGDPSAEVVMIGGSVDSDVWMKLTIKDVIHHEEIDPFTQAEWYYAINLYSDNSEYATSKIGPSETDHWKPNTQHKLDIIDQKIKIKIKLMEDDLVLDDLADISCQSGQGVDQFQISEWLSGEADGAIFNAEYDIKENKLVGECGTVTDIEPDTILRAEGSNGANHAEVLFTIEDNYELIANGNGPYSGSVDVDVQFIGEARGGLPDYTYTWTFGDGATGSGEITTHSYDEPGTYTATLKVEDVWGSTAFDNDISVTIGANSDPNKPTIAGPSSGSPDQSYQFTFTVDDPDNGDILDLEIDWGDQESDYVNDLNVGESKQVSHSWSRKGGFNIKARCTDSSGNVGPWSDPFNIVMPKNKIIENPLIRFLNNIPIFKNLLISLFSLI